jgi:hypothetical protein
LLRYSVEISDIRARLKVIEVYLGGLARFMPGPVFVETLVMVAEDVGSSIE